MNEFTFLFSRPPTVYISVQVHTQIRTLCCRSVYDLKTELKCILNILYLELVTLISSSAQVSPEKNGNNILRMT